jgi:type IV fimbrial biogenesis protein FimT
VLKQSIRQLANQGFTLIELMVVVSIMALMVVMFAPDMAVWISNSKVRGTAESLASELRLAQVEALRRNRQAVFALTNASPAPTVDAAPAANGLNWYVRALPSAPEAAEPGFDATSLYVHGSNQARMAEVRIVGPALVCFSALGQAIKTPNTAVGGVATCTPPVSAVIPVTYTIDRRGADRRLQVQVALGGMIRLCDPDETKSRADGKADACQ